MSTPEELESEADYELALEQLEALTLEYMQASVLEDVRVVNVQSVTWPEWCNPSTASWQTAIVGTAP